jgi:uncharacterized membrane protein YphA (DoxX/SURF4 family)
MTTRSLSSPAVARPRFRTLILWLLRIALAAMFLGAGFSKLAGEPVMVEMFAVIGAGQWLRYFVGVCEVAGAVGVLVPRLSVLAAAGLALLMVGASIANVTVLDTSPATTLLIFLAALLTVWLGLSRPSRGAARTAAVAPTSGVR